jgi:hypothetical protein
VVPDGVHIGRVHHVLHLHASADFALIAVFDAGLLCNVELAGELLCVLILENLQFGLSSEFRRLKSDKLN